MREAAKLSEEISKFALCYALSEHHKADRGGDAARVLPAPDIGDLTAGILRDEIRPGDVVEGEALLSRFTAIYRPRAYYPSYVLGEMRAALRRGERPPGASPHYLAVNTLPPLEDGWRIAFLYPVGKDAFDRMDFPSHVRDVLTRDFYRMPMLLSPGHELREGKVAYRARVLRLDRETLDRLAGLGERSYEAYSARGLTFFLLPLELEERDSPHSMRGSIYAELRLPEESDRQKVMRSLEDAVRGAAEELFPLDPRGERRDDTCRLPHTGFHVLKYRSKLLTVVYDPVIVIYRAPLLMGVFLPCDLPDEMGEKEPLLGEFVRLLEERLRGIIGYASSPGVDICYDNRLDWARDGGALSGPSFRGIEERYAFLGPTLAWLRGD